MTVHRKSLIYLCSRVAPDAHPLNNRVAEALKAAGHEVFVPHAAPYNSNQEGVSDQDIYRQDMEQMLQADACVVVGRVGVDCAFEVGWFQGRQVPTIWYVPHGTSLTTRSPMLEGVRCTSSLDTVLTFLSPEGT